jgi:hypothetical protein
MLVVSARLDMVERLERCMAFIDRELDGSVFGDRFEGLIAEIGDQEKFQEMVRRLSLL